MTGLLMAMHFVLTRVLSINLPFIRIGFSFIPMALVGIFYGPLYGAVASGLVDLLGALLLPTGPFYPGFTITATLAGFVYGYFLHEKVDKKANLLGAIVFINAVLYLGLNSFWLWRLMGAGVWAMMPERLLKSLIMVPVEYFTLRALAPRLVELEKTVGENG